MIKYSTLLLLVVMAMALPAEAKNDSTKMARKAERQLEREERERQAEIERMAQPRFKGGDIDKFERWVVANLRYDYGELPRSTPHVRIDVPFLVNADGTTSLVEGENPSEQLYPRLVHEIERVILFSPDWEPGHTPQGEPIPSLQTCSITLKNNDYIGMPTAGPKPRTRPVRRRR